MKKPHAFRPSLHEILETRAVPSMAGVAFATGLAGVSVTLPAQVSPSSPQVQGAFAAFDASYIRAVDTYLSAFGPGGQVTPQVGRANFVSAVEQSLNSLAEQLVLSLSAGSTTTTTTTTPAGPTSSTSSTPTTTTATSTPTAASQVVSAIVGGGSTSLEGQLLAASAAQVALQVPITGTGTGGGQAQAAVANVVGTAEQVRPTVRVPVAEATGASTTTLPASTSAGDSTTAPGSVRSAFNGFLNDYFKAVQGVLLAPGTSGQVNPSANRAAFDAEVGQAIQSLENQVSAALTRNPATSGLGAQVRSALGGAGASSLKAQLSGLATPQAAQAAVVRDFTLNSTQAIARALSLIGADVSKLTAPAGP